MLQRIDKEWIVSNKETNTTKMLENQRGNEMPFSLTKKKKVYDLKI